jgi:Tol biopolymer transport system component
MRKHSQGTWMVWVAFVMTLPWAAMVIGSANPAEAALPGHNGGLLATETVVTPQFQSQIIHFQKDGSGYRALANCSGGCANGDWSPSGGRLVFADRCRGCYNRISIVRADGSGGRIVIDAGHIGDGGGDLRSPTWSPSGKRIAFIRQYCCNSRGTPTTSMYTIRPNGTHLKLIPGTTRLFKDDLDWSSRNLFVFSGSRHRAQPDSYELWKMRPDGSHLTRLTHNNVVDRHPDWGPGGRWLTYEHWSRGSNSNHVWKMTAQGRKRTRLARGSSPAWSPNGRLIAFVVNHRDVHTMNPEGNNKSSLSPVLPGDRGGISYLDWQPSK